MKSFFLSLVLLTVGGFSNAATPSFTNLSQADFEKVSKEFSANFTHHSVTGAATLGSVFGFELALVGGLMPSPNTDAVVKANSSGNELPQMAHAGLLLGVSVPFGFSGELVMVPKMSQQNSDYQSSSMALKWTFSEFLPVPFLNLALRASSSAAKFSFSQTSGGVVGTVEDSSKVTGLMLLVSPSLLVVEPYFGVGQLTANNSLGVSGTGSVFNTTYTSAQSAETTPTSTEILVGINAKLLVFSLGAEYYQAFGASGYTAKLGMAF